MKLDKKRLLETLKIFVLFSAGFHILLLVIYSIIRTDIVHLNYFNIVDLDLFFPTIIDGALNQVLAFIVMLVIFMGIYFYRTGSKS